MDKPGDQPGLPRYPLEQIIIREGVAEDLPALFALERAAHAHPWSQDILEDMLESASVTCQVMENPEHQMLGFAFVQAAADEASLLNIVIDPSLQGRGLGRHLLNAVIDRLLATKVIEHFFLEVRVSNFAAIALYLSCGFVEVGERRDYYPAKNGSRENALMMAMPLAAAY
jgi:ribosomal-protein-alanine N-acetyltransferase